MPTLNCNETRCPTVVDVKWMQFDEAAKDREYLAMISFLPRKSRWTIFDFLRRTRAIQKQLAKSEGLIGYSLRTQIFGKRSWTLSVWSDEIALAKFVGASPHGQTARDLRPELGETRFVKWKILGSGVPPGWDDAMSRLQPS